MQPVLEAAPQGLKLDLMPSQPELVGNLRESSENLWESSGMPSRTELEVLKEALVFWMTTQCEFIFICAEKLRDAEEHTMPRMVNLQELRSWEGWTVRKVISLEDALNDKYVDEYLTLSYR